MGGFIKFPGDILKIVIPIVKDIWDMVRSKKDSDNDLSMTEGINENTRVDDIDKIVEIFSESREQLHKKTVKIEEAVFEEVKFYIEELQNILSERKEAVEKYGIKFVKLERKIEKIEGNIQKSMDDEISKRMSLDNQECFQIMKMIPGEKKEKAISDFMRKTINMALDKCCEEIDAVLRDFFEEVSEDLLDTIEIVQNEYKNNAENLLSVDADNYKEKSLEIQKNAGIVLSACEMADYVLKEGK